MVRIRPNLALVVLAILGVLLLPPMVSAERGRSHPVQEIWYHTGYPGGVSGPRAGMSARMGPTKMPLIFEAIQQMKLVPSQQIHTDSSQVRGRLQSAPPIDLASLRAVHSDRYLKALFTGQPKSLACSQGLSSWAPEMAKGWLLNVGGLYEAAVTALDKKTITANLGHGYHHAGVERGEGYCTINGLAVVAQKLLKTRRVQRVMVLDLDQHEGNGTAACTLGDPRIWNVSIYGTSMDGPPGAVNNHVTQVHHGRLRQGAYRDMNYLATVSSQLPALIRQQNPDVILYQAGMDPHDCAGITPMALAQRDAFVFALARSLGKPLAWVLAGGYSDVGTLQRLHTNTVRMANLALQKIKRGDPIRMSNTKPYNWSIKEGEARFPDWSTLTGGSPKATKAKEISPVEQRRFVADRDQLRQAQQLPESELLAAYRAIIAP